MLPLIVLAALSAAPFTINDGDTVVFLGNTLIEREQIHGWWELGLTTRYPGKSIKFRNLGWSGETVFGHARVGYAYTRTNSASIPGGFAHLRDHTLSLKPNVILLAFGTNESFEGPKGLPAFTEGLTTLLDKLAPTKARIVLLSPLRQGTMPAPLPAPTTANKNLRLYADAIRNVAKKRDLLFVDLFDLIGDVGTSELSDNGIHLTDDGYRRTSTMLEHGLKLPPTPWKMEIDAKTMTAKGVGFKVEHVDGLKFKVTDKRLPTRGRMVLIRNMTEPYELLIDGKVVDRLDPKKDQGTMLMHGPDFDQLDKLRKAIVDKNQLYFHRWRPQNETYLFGFRKHEQGKNGIEIPKFDPLIAAKEKEIAVLAKPIKRIYELRPVK